VLTEVGEVEIDTPRDRDGSFEPQIVKKRQRRLSGVDELVISLAAKGLTTGEIAAHFADVYGRRCRGTRSPGSPIACSRRWSLGRAGQWTRSIR
jgi:transposase-like protein